MRTIPVGHVNFSFNPLEIPSNPPETGGLEVNIVARGARLSPVDLDLHIPFSLMRQSAMKPEQYFINVCASAFLRLPEGYTEVIAQFKEISNAQDQ